MYNLVNRSPSGLSRGRAVPIVERMACSDLVRIVAEQCVGAVPAVDRIAFGTALVLGILGFACVPLSILLHRYGVVNGFVTLTMVGSGIYLPYVLIHTTVFERWIAIVRRPGSAAFLLTLADAIAYLAYVVALLIKPMVQKSGNILGLFETVGFWISLSSIAMLVAALVLTSRQSSQISGQRGTA